MLGRQLQLDVGTWLALVETHITGMAPEIQQEQIWNNAAKFCA